MSRNIKSLKKLHSLIGQVVHVVDSEGHTFDAVVEKCSIPGIPNKYAVDLVTAYDIADEDPYWWPKSVSEKTWGHHVVRPHQLTEELRSVTTIKEKAETKTVEVAKKSYVSFMDLLASEGHYCEMADGTTGFIAGSKYPNHVCVIHNSEGPSEGWTISRYGRESEILGVSKSFLKRFSKAWHVGSEDEAEQVKVAEILIKAGKTKKAKRKTKESVSTKESFLTREQLLEHVGKRCKMSDGTEGLIVKTDSGTPRVLMKARANDHGWLYNETVEYDTGASVEVRGQYKYAWNVTDNEDAEDISVVEILEDDSEKCAESSKTILDMTIREVLEKLNEIIKC